MRHQRNIGSRQLDNRFHTPSVQQCAAERTQRDLDVFPAPDEGLGLPVIFLSDALSQRARERFRI